jgi:hypothetical protein
MNYKIEDFSRCLFNPLEKNFLKKYEQLQSISSDERMMRYIAAMYDYNSPIVRDYRDMEFRKKCAASLAGYDLRKDETILAELTEFKGDVAITAIDKFLKEFIHSRLWYMICAREQTIYEYAKRMLKPVSEGENDKEKDLMNAISIKSKLSEDMAQMEKLLEQDYNKLYGNDDGLKKAATSRFTPEDRATNV